MDEKKKDIFERALKTFVQAFLGVLVPVVVAMLNGGWPESFGAAWAVLAPAVSAALAAGISAVWNYAKNRDYLKAVAYEHSDPDCSHFAECVETAGTKPMCDNCEMNDAEESE